MFHNNTFFVNKNSDNNGNLLKCSNKSFDIIIVFKTKTMSQFV